MILKIFIEDNNLLMKYIEEVEEHNKKIQRQDFPDAGFDLYIPEDTIFGDEVNKINYEIKCSAYLMNHKRFTPTGYYIYPRSSITKTPLRLANSVGIIDSGYRGKIQGLFDLHKNGLSLTQRSFYANKYDRFLQICAPGLVPILVEIVTKEKDLSPKTERGSGGIGSTGA